MKPPAWTRSPSCLELPLTDPAAVASPAARESGWRRATRSVLIVLLLGAAAAGGYHYAQSDSGDKVMLTPEQVQAQEAALRQRDTELRYLRTQLVSADGEVVVERAAREELEAQLRASQAELGRVRDQLAFYEQLLPPGPAGAIDIRGAEFARVGSDLRYRVLMMRSGRSESPFSGELRFVANGIQQGQTVSVELQPQRVKTEESAAPGAVLPAAAGGAVDAAAPADPGNGASLLTVHFDHFQRSQGVLALPEGFVPESVTISVLEGSNVRATREVQLEF